MCKRTKKLLFAAGCAMQILVFISSVRYTVRRVVNNKGKGSTIDQFSKITPSSITNAEDVVLDNATGDIYCLDFENNELIPIANAGLHYHKSA